MTHRFQQSIAVKSVQDCIHALAEKHFIVILFLLWFNAKKKRDMMANDDQEAFARMVRVEASVANDKLLPNDIHLWLTTSRNKEGINIDNEDIAHLYGE